MFGRKGMLFSIDVLIAMGVLLSIMVILPLLSVTQTPSSQNSALLAQDAVNVLATITINDLDNDYVDTLIADEHIRDPTLTVLEQIAEFHTENKTEYAAELSQIVLGNFTQKYAIFVNNQEVFSNQEMEEVQTLVSARRMVSGFTDQQARLGFVARAFASQVGKNNTMILKGDIIKSSVRKPSGGNNQNKVNITYTFELPQSTTIHEAYWFIQAPWTTTNFRAFANNQHIPGSDATGAVLLDNLEGYFHEGINTATVEGKFGANANEGGEDGSSHLVVSYTTGQYSTLRNLTTKQFAEVNSHTSIRYKMPVFSITELFGLDVFVNAIGPNATLTLEIDGISKNVSTKNIVSNNVQWSSSEIQTVLTDMGHTFNGLSGRYFYVQVDIDSYSEREELGSHRAILPGSQVVLNAGSTEGIYGRIDITKIVPVYSYSTSLWTSYYRNALWKFEIPINSTPLMVDSQLAWLYVLGTDPSQDVRANNLAVYQHPSQPLVVELARVGYDGTNGKIESGENNYSLSFGDGYAIEPTKSLVDFTILIRNFVGYGAVFETEADAEADAVARLESLLGDVITATEITLESEGIGNVPSLWGPAQVEVRVWT